MTRQVSEGSPITITVRSVATGGFVPDAPLDIDGQAFRDPDCTETFDEHKANGAGEFVFYAPPGTVVTVSSPDPDAAGIEPVQVVGVTSRPGGLSAVTPEQTPAVHDTSPVSEQVSDLSLVSAVHPQDALPADQGGQAGMVGVNEAQNVPPAEPATDEEPTAAPSQATASGHGPGEHGARTVQTQASAGTAEPAG